MTHNNPIRSKSFQFAVDIVNLYKTIVIEHKEFVLSRQILKSGTSVGANIREGQNAETKPDFIHKFGIAQKECAETLYWLELLKETAYIDDVVYAKLSDDATVLIKIIKSSIITAKANLKK